MDLVLEIVALRIVIDGFAFGFGASVTGLYTASASAIGPLNVCTAACAARMRRGNAAAANPSAGMASKATPSH